MRPCVIKTHFWSHLLCQVTFPVFLLVFTDARGYLSLTNHPPEEEEKDHEGY